jgi:hypothetical protein
MKKWEESIQTLMVNFNNIIKRASEEFEEGFSPIYTAFEEINEALVRRKELRDLYATDYD